MHDTALGFDLCNQRRELFLRAACRADNEAFAREPPRDRTISRLTRADDGCYFFSPIIFPLKF
jgi:hypothetical protein